MPLPLPTPIELFMSSENTHDLEALADCFAAHATVRDEGQTLQGLKAIQAWRLETRKKYRHTVEPVAVTARDGKTVVSTKLTGDFPGSPAPSRATGRTRTTRTRLAGTPNVRVQATGRSYWRIPAVAKADGDQSIRS
jgi:SnoaL-like domain